MSTAKVLCRPLLLIVAVVLVVPTWGGDAPAADSTQLTAPEVRVRSQVPPYYPATASLTRADAVVVLAVQVGADGKIADLEVVDCDRPEFGFEDAATDAVRHWKFKPATKDGQAVPTETFVTLYIGPPSRGQYSGEAYTRSAFGAVPPSIKLPSPGEGWVGRGPSTRGELDQGIAAAERPNCPRGQRCIYDRSQLNRRNRLVEMPRPAPPPR